jgi:hypothetical protein
MAIVLYPDPMVSRTLGRLENMLVIADSQQGSSR